MHALFRERDQRSSPSNLGVPESGGIALSVCVVCQDTPYGDQLCRGDREGGGQRVEARERAVVQTIPNGIRCISDRLRRTAAVENTPARRDGVIRDVRAPPLGTMWSTAPSLGARGSGLLSYLSTTTL